MRREALALFALCLTGISYAATIHVPADQATIQAGVNAAANWDTVLVAPGVYSGDGNRDLDFLGKSLVVQTEGGPEVTTIDCGGSTGLPHGAFGLRNVGDTLTKIIGFTMTGGVPYAISLETASPLLMDCRFENCGSGVLIPFAGSGGSHPVIKRCTFSNNVEGGWCGPWSTMTFDSCVFLNNRARAVSACCASTVYMNGAVVIGCGGDSGPSVNDNSTFLATDYAHMVLTNTTVFGSRGDDTTAVIRCIYGGSAELNNCIIAYSQCGLSFAAPVELYPGIISISCSNFFGNRGGDWIGPISGMLGINGNLSANPLFCDTASLDLHLPAESPCAPSNNSCATLIGALSVQCVCCNGTTGNVNAIGIVDLVDLSSLVNYLTEGGYILPCNDEANVNGVGIVDLVDLSSLVSYLSGGGYVLPNCP